MLREDKLPDELVGGLRVQRQGVAQRLQIWTLFQEGLLQANPTRVEVLLHKGRTSLSAHRITMDLDPGSDLLLP